MIDAKLKELENRISENKENLNFYYLHRKANHHFEVILYNCLSDCASINFVNSLFLLISS